MTEKEQDLQITKINESIKGLSRVAERLKVVDEPSLKRAIDFSSKVKTQRYEIEKDRKFFTDPLNGQVKKINARFKPLTILLDELEKIAKASIGEYRQKQEDDRIKEETRIKKIAQKRFDKATEKAKEKDKPLPVYVPPALPVVSNRVQTKDSSMLEKDVPDYKIVDELQIPLEYWELNHVKIRKAVRKGVKEIPGINIFMKKQINIMR